MRYLLNYNHVLIIIQCTVYCVTYINRFLEIYYINTTQQLLWFIELNNTVIYTTLFPLPIYSLVR